MIALNHFTESSYWVLLLGLFWSNPLIYLLLAFGLPRGKVYDLLYRWLMLLTICTSAYLINIGIQVMTVQRHYFDGNLILLIYLPVLLLSLFGIFKPFSYDHILCFLSQIATRIYRIFLAPLYQRLANLLKLRWYVIFGLATLFASIWFLPFSSKMHCGEIGLIRFRFQVFTYDSTYVSRTTWSEFKEILIRFNVVKMPKYGPYRFFEKVGDWQEYLGFNALRCSNGELAKNWNDDRNRNTPVFTDSNINKIENTDKSLTQEIRKPEKFVDVVTGIQDDPGSDLDKPHVLPKASETPTELREYGIKFRMTYAEVNRILNKHGFLLNNDPEQQKGIPEGLSCGNGVSAICSSGYRHPLDDAIQFALIFEYHSDWILVGNY